MESNNKELKKILKELKRQGEIHNEEHGDIKEDFKLNEKMISLQKDYEGLKAQAKLLGWVATGLGAMMMSILVIVIPAGVMLYSDVQTNKTNIVANKDAILTNTKEDAKHASNPDLHHNIIQSVNDIVQDIVQRITKVETMIEKDE